MYFFNNYNSTTDPSITGANCVRPSTNRLAVTQSIKMPHREWRNAFREREQKLRQKRWRKEVTNPSENPRDSEAET